MRFSFILSNNDIISLSFLRYPDYTPPPPNLSIGFLKIINKIPTQYEKNPIEITSNVDNLFWSRKTVIFLYFSLDYKKITSLVDDMTKKHIFSRQYQMIYI